MSALSWSSQYLAGRKHEAFVKRCQRIQPLIRGTAIETPLFQNAVCLYNPPMTLTCFHCKKPASTETCAAPLKIGFRDSCSSCGSDLHVCKNCRFYDPGCHHECREISAEWVRDKERYNLCEYFNVRSSSEGDQENTKAAALNALEDLFKKI